MPTAIPRASGSPPPRWPHSPSNAARSMASGTTPSHPSSSRHEAVIPRQVLSSGRAPKRAVPLAGDAAGASQEHATAEASEGRTDLSDAGGNDWRDGGALDPTRHGGTRARTAG